MKVPISSIERDIALQLRVKRIDLRLVGEYAEAMERGDVFPPIIVFADEPSPTEATRLWPGDGWHRIEACESIDAKTIEADVRPGGRRAAFLFALGANDNHGLRRTRADKHNAVEAALADVEMRQLSDREIGRLCGVDKNTVARVRAENPDLELLDAKRRGRDGKVRGAKKPQLVNSPVGPEVVNSPPEPAPLHKGEPPRVPIRTLFNELDSTLEALMEQWPEHKRHAFCVKLYQFCNDHDPEVDEMNRTARQVHNPTMHAILSPKPGDAAP